MKRLPAPKEPTTDKTPTLGDKAHVWLKEDYVSTPSQTCKVCGVSQNIGSALIMAGNSGTFYHYTDAFGKQISSLIPLPCPVFIGDTNGAIAEAKTRVRRLDGRMGGVETKVESIEERLTRLEEENVALKTQLDTKIKLDVTEIINWMSQVAKLQPEQFPALPEPIRQIVVETAREKEYVEGEFEPEAGEEKQENL